MTEQVALQVAPEEDTSNQVFLPDINTIQSMLSPETAAKRAAKTAVAFNLPTHDELLNEFAGGREDQVRNALAAVVNQEQDIKKKQFITAAIAKYKGNMDLVTASQILKGADETYRHSDPNTVIEEKFAENYADAVHRAAEANPSYFLNEAVKEIPQKVDQASGIVREVKAKQELINRTLNDLEDAKEHQGWGSWTWDLTRGMVPLRDQIRLRGLTDNFWSTEIGLGGNLEETAQNLLRKPFPEFKDSFLEIYYRLRNDDLNLAHEFVAALRGMSGGDIMVKNMLGILDIASVPGLVTAGRLTTKLVKGKDLLSPLKNVTENLIKQVDDVGLKTAADIRANTAAVVGDASTAVREKAVQRVTEDLKGTSRGVQRDMELIPEYMRADLQAIKADPGTVLAREGLARIEENYHRLIEKISEIITAPNVDRIPELNKVPGAVELVQKEIRDTYRGNDNKIMHITAPYYNDALKSTFADIWFGQRGDQLWFNPQVAKNWAHNVAGLVDAKVVPEGGGWKVVKSVPVDETGALRSVFTKHADVKYPEWGSIKSILSWIRGPEDTLSLAERANRKVATTGPSALMKVMRDNLSSIENLAKFTLPGLPRRKVWDQFETTLRMARELWDVSTKQKGYFFRTGAELENFYKSKFNRLPHPVEMEAYFAYTSTIEAERMINAMSIASHKLRYGTEQHQIVLLGKNGERVEGPWFEGVRQNDRSLPGGQDTMMVIEGGKFHFITVDDMHKALEEEKLAAEAAKAAAEGKKKRVKGVTEEKTGKVELMANPHTTPAQKTKWKEDLKNGQKIRLEVYDVPSRPFEGWNGVEGQKVRWILVDKDSAMLNTKNLDIQQQIGRAGGGHFDYDYKYAVKYPKIVPERVGNVTNWNYEGDVFAYFTRTQREAEEGAKVLTEIADLLRAGKVDEARAVAGSKFSEEFDKIQAAFKHSFNPDGEKVPPRFSLEGERLAFRAVPKNTFIGDLDSTLKDQFKGKGNFKDGTKGGSLSRQNQALFAQERDAWEVHALIDKGSKGNPVFDLEPAKLVDPIPMLDRAITRIINSSYMDDMKIFSVERWLTEAQKYLKEGSDAMYTPFASFHKPEWLSGADKIEVSRLEANRQKILAFQGQKGVIQSHLETMSQKLANSIYGSTSPGRFRDVAITAAEQLPLLADPFAFLRSFTFHLKLGMLNPWQWVKQQQTFFTIMAINPREAIPATTGAYLHLMTRWTKNEDIWKFMDKIASGFGWKPGEWLEATRMADALGFSHVGAEYAMREHKMQFTTLRGIGKQILDAGDVIFQQAEKQVRLAAWYSAFKEWRRANPFAKITNDAQREILNRADLLNNNMTRASSSLLNTGLPTTTQFLTYQIRFMEQMFGKRLTVGEKARVLATVSAIYGVGGPLGVYGLAAGDYLKQKAMEGKLPIPGADVNDPLGPYVPGDSWVRTAFYESPLAIAAAWLSGKGDLSKGTIYNINQAFGMPGLQPIREALRGDKPLWDLITGASGSVVRSLWEQTDGLRYAWTNFVRPKDQRFEPQTSDYLDVFKEISVVNSVHTYIVALNTGIAFSRKGKPLGEISQQDALVKFLTGLSPIGQSDIYEKALTLKARKEVATDGEERFLKEYRNYLLALKTGDYDGAHAYARRGNAILEMFNVPDYKMAEVRSRASKALQSIEESIDWSYYITHAPKGDEATMREAMRTKLRIENARKGK